MYKADEGAVKAAKDWLFDSENQKSNAYPHVYKLLAIIRGMNAYINGLGGDAIESGYFGDPIVPKRLDEWYTRDRVSMGELSKSDEYTEELAKLLFSAYYTVLKSKYPPIQDPIKMLIATTFDELSDNDQDAWRAVARSAREHFNED